MSQLKSRSNELSKLNKIHYLVDKHGMEGKGEEKIKKKLMDTDYELLSLRRGVASFKNKKDNSIAVSVKGTDITNKKDLISDIRLGLGFSKYDKQFNNRKNIIKQIYKQHPGADKYLTGHSLGGSIVTSAMVKSKSIRDNTKKAIGYNTGYTRAFHNELSKGLTPKDKKDINKKLVHHHIKQDIVSEALTGRHIGNLKKYDISSVNPLTKHSLTSVIDVIEKKEEKKEQL